MLLAACCFAACAQEVEVDFTDGDGYRYVRTAQVTFYDNFFHTAWFAVSAVVSPEGEAFYQLEVTYDEGYLKIARGDTLNLTLRGGDVVRLFATHDVERSDVVKRHYADHNDYLITCRYALPVDDIRRLYQTRTTKMSARMASMRFDRRVDAFQARFSRMFNNVFARVSKPHAAVHKIG